jgi:hypothetical protein
LEQRLLLAGSIHQGLQALNNKKGTITMKSHFPDDDNIFAAALPDIRAHFENAVRSGREECTILGAILADLKGAETDVTRIPATRAQFVVMTGALQDFPVLEAEVEAAAAICRTHEKKMKGPGA